MPKRGRAEDYITESGEMEVLPASKVRRIYDHVGEQLQKIRRKSESDAGKRTYHIDRYEEKEKHSDFGKTDKDRHLKELNFDSCHDLLEKIFTYKTKTVLQHTNFFIRNESELDKDDKVDDDSDLNATDNVEISEVKVKDEIPSPAKTVPLVFGKGSNMYNPIVIFDGKPVDLDEDGVAIAGDTEEEENIEVVNLDETTESEMVKKCDGTRQVKLECKPIANFAMHVVDSIKTVKPENIAPEKELEKSNMNIKQGSILSVTLVGGERRVRSCLPCNTVVVNANSKTKDSTKSVDRVKPQKNRKNSPDKKSVTNGRDEERSRDITIGSVRGHTSRSQVKRPSSNAGQTGPSDKGKLKTSKSASSHRKRPISNTQHTRKDNEKHSDNNKENENSQSNRRGKSLENETKYRSFNPSFTEKRKRVRFDLKKNVTRRHDTENSFSKMPSYESTSRNIARTKYPIVGLDQKGRNFSFSQAEVQPLSIETDAMLYNYNSENIQVNLKVNTESSRSCVPPNGHRLTYEHVPSSNHRRVEYADLHTSTTTWQEKLSKSVRMEIPWFPISCHVCRSHFRDRTHFLDHVNKFKHCPFSIRNRREVDLYLCSYCPYDTRSLLKIMIHYKATHWLYFKETRAKYVKMEALIRY